MDLEVPASLLSSSPMCNSILLFVSQNAPFPRKHLLHLRPKMPCTDIKFHVELVEVLYNSLGFTPGCTTAYLLKETSNWKELPLFHLRPN